MENHRASLVGGNLHQVDSRLRGSGSFGVPEESKQAVMLMFILDNGHDSSHILWKELMDACLNFSEFNTLTMELHLSIFTTNKIKSTISVASNQVTSSVHSLNVTARKPVNILHPIGSNFSANI
ncbi:hypothetical protein Trco_006928 [Trichoderma cornu-damae]|uniref:Uncharacterized protein n=1 Tax=Trichoderma cornu-damae TaxID=654480 RepID=A0A9P8QHK3_9HYPO|nr:hypothetical protein Trco_006928 [Trichoderma cornu-damae]